MQPLITTCALVAAAGAATTLGSPQHMKVLRPQPSER
jgi:hypothetical protein